MATVTFLVLAAFFVGAAVGALLIYMYLSARVEQTKERFARELHRIIAREERAHEQSRRTAA
jgi:hypothetical protein